MAIDKPLYDRDPEDMSDDDLEAEIGALEILIEDPESVTLGVDGEPIMVIEPDGAGDGEEDFGANLAELLDESELASISDQLLDAYSADLRSREPWERTYEEGLELLGLKIEARHEPWDGAFGVYHPILAEAVVKFQSETITETFPAAGPVKTKIIGAPNREAEASAHRVREDMNYILTEKMPDYRSEHERLLWNLPIAGSAFKKIFNNTQAGRPVAQFVPAEDFVVSYGATDLLSAQRYTHRTKRSKNEIRRLQLSGFYRDIDLAEAVADESDIDARKDDLSGYDSSEDGRYTLLEFHCDLDIPGFEDVDANGDPTGLEIPYVVTVEKNSGEVLAIYRNWLEDDPGKTKRIHFSHYTYIPGFGFYGLGLIHLIGGFAKGATSILRQLVDAGTLSNLPGGFRTRGLRIKGGDTPIAPGEFRDVDVPTGTIKDNIMALPFKEPSNVLYNLLQNIVAEGRRFASVSDITVSDMQPNAPVGSTLAILERQLKTMTAIQARVHAAMTSEFKILKGLVEADAPDGDADYGYDAYGTTHIGARRLDFMRVEIIPVSDPNASSMSQRIIQYQAVMQLAQQAPQLYDLPLLHRQMVQVLGIKEAEKLVPMAEDQKPMDPVSENMALLNDKPVKAFAYQDHEAHIRMHMAFGNSPKIQEMLAIQGPAGETKIAAGLAHINEHLAFQYRNEVEKQLGVPLPYVGEDDAPLPEDVEVSLSRVVAEAGDRLLGNQQAEAQQRRAQEAAEDPVVQQQRAEFELEKQEQERKQAKDLRDYEIALAKVETELLRIQSQSQQAGAAIGAKAAADKLKISLEQSKHTAKTRAEGMRMALEATKPPTGGPQQ